MTPHPPIYLFICLFHGVCTLDCFSNCIPSFFKLYFSVEQSVFKAKFDAWDDVLAVDFTRTAGSISGHSKVLMNVVYHYCYQFHYC